MIPSTTQPPPTGSHPTAPESSAAGGDDAPSVGAMVRAAVAGLRLVVWLATPVLLYMATIALTPFFGELPDARDQATAGRFLAMAVGTGVGAPLLAARLAGRIRAVRVIAVVELVISAAAAVLIAVWVR